MDVESIFCKFEENVLTMKLRVHDGFGDEDIRNLNRLYETDVTKGRYSDNIGKIAQILPLQGKTSEVIENTPNAPLIKARGILIKDRSGNTLCANKCGEVTDCGSRFSAGSEMWLAERIQGTTKYAFRSFFGKYLTAQKDSGYVSADKHIALACEV